MQNIFCQILFFLSRLKCRVVRARGALCSGCVTGTIDREVLCVALGISNGGFRLPVPGDANASEAEVLLLTRPCLNEVPTGAIG